MSKPTSSRPTPSTPIRSRPIRLIVIAVAVATIVPAAFTPPDSSADSWVDPEQAPRAAQPEDRYALAGGCYAVEALDSGQFIAVSGSGFSATAPSLDAAEPFHFHATRLGEYLLFASGETYLAATGVVELPLGGPAIPAGSGVGPAAEPSPSAEWNVDGDPSGYTMRVRATGQGLSADPAGSLTAVDGDGDTFAFHLTDGCAEWPEVPVNVTGPPTAGASPLDEVVGMVEGHMHGMAFEFLSGRLHCGRPWHPYGVTYALRDCEEHRMADGRLAASEWVLSGDDPVNGHGSDGWPTFGSWPGHDELTHEGMYYRWLERAWRGGLRVFVNLFVENSALCEAWPFKRNSCNDMDSVRLQAQRIHELEDYIDAQSGGPGEGWFRIVTDHSEARRVINEGKLAVVLGIEVSTLFDCGERLDVPSCTEEDLEPRLDEVYDMGVRQMELVNKFDNALSGVTGDSGSTGTIVSVGNFWATGHWWDMRTCESSTDERGLRDTDKTQINPVDDGPGLDDGSDRAGLAAQVLSAYAGASGGVGGPVYPPGPHCNARGLTPLGERLLELMMDRGMIFDPDHMSAAAQRQALEIVEERGYRGVISSHSWATEATVPRVYELGGLVTPYAGGAQGFVDKWRWHKQWYENVGRTEPFAIGYGADMNGLGGQGGPRRPNEAEDVDYPFPAPFDPAILIDQQVSGERTYDINTDGVAHYGLYPDWIRDLQLIAGPGDGNGNGIPDGEEIVADLARGAEAYLEMWELADGVEPNDCVTPQDSLSKEDVHAMIGSDALTALETLGQPSKRKDSVYEYCVAGEGGVVQTVKARFDDDGILRSVTDGPIVTPTAAGGRPDPPAPLASAGHAHQHGDAIDPTLAASEHEQGPLGHTRAITLLTLGLLLVGLQLVLRPRRGGAR